MTLKLLQNGLLGKHKKSCAINYKRNYLCTTGKIKNVGLNASRNVKVPEPPDNCCMSGCANCVWIHYAEDLAKIYNDGGKKAKEQIERLVTDTSLRMFLRLQLNEKKDSTD